MSGFEDDFTPTATSNHDDPDQDTTDTKATHTDNDAAARVSLSTTLPVL